MKKEVPWPQNYILGGTTKSRVNYDSLSISQWVSGFATIIKDEKNAQVKQNMLEYLSEIMEDSHDFGWGAANGAHPVLLCKMEEGRVDWADTHKIDRIRRAHAHKVQNYNTSLHSIKRNEVPLPKNSFKNPHVHIKLTMKQTIIPTSMSAASVFPMAKIPTCTERL